MKLHTERAGDTLRITAYGEGYFVVGDRRVEHSLALGPGELLEAWAPLNLRELCAQAPALIRRLDADVVLLGTGRRHRFPEPALLAPLYAAGAGGLEVMDTGAACRTYNVLLGEGRRVAALMLLIGLLEDAVD